MAQSELDRRVAAVALEEWWFFGSQYIDSDNPGGAKQIAPGSSGSIGDESQGGFKERVWTYFKYGVFPTSDDWKKLKTDPWSAAFISFCMRIGGTGDRFPYSASHSDYATKSVRNRLANITQNTIVGYDVTEVFPEVGDLLWKGRRGTDNEIDTTNWTYQDIIHHLENGGGSFPSHCDLVVAVDSQNNVLYTIGGNVADTVLRLKAAIDSNGMLKSTRFKMVIKNNIQQTV